MLLAELPFEDLEPGDFEDFAVTLARSLYPGAEPFRQGKSGHTQYGFDVVVERGGKVLAGIQCKRAQEFGPREVTKAVTAATMKADTALIFLSRTASPDARAALRAHRGWQLWDKNKLSHAVHDLPLDRAVSLVDRYFPLLREKFLGVPLPGPWLDPAQYFSRTSRSERSSHQWPLVGRDGLLEDLAQFAIRTCWARGTSGRARRDWQDEDVARVVRAPASARGLCQVPGTRPGYRPPGVRAASGRPAACSHRRRPR